MFLGKVLREVFWGDVFSGGFYGRISMDVFKG